MSLYQKSHEDKDLLNKIVSALMEGRDIESNSLSKDINFCVEDTIAPTDIEVKVKEVGKLSFPLTKADVQKLLNVSTTAKFGMGEETVLDKNIRNTQMIEAGNLNVTVNQESLSRFTNKMHKALDLPADSTLTPHLYNMLIYGPGQFFNKHRDSEKLQNMIATLVIILPSPHIGGDLIIEHGKKKYIFSSENVDEDNAKCICFYSDCLHEVSKVKCGYRVALTFNVVLEAGEFVTAASVNEELTVAVRDYFSTATVKNKKIVFFLNHTYSEHSLLWSVLKGEDYQYASKFRSVAEQLDLDVHLALADIHQCWSSASEDEADPDWLVDTEGTLNFWVDVNNVKLPYSNYSTSRNEICFTKETHYSNFEPTEEDFSGPTGNEGATVDYWYKRAAIVLWQKSDSMTVQFELNYDGAMTELRTLISVPGNEEKVKETLNKASELLHKDCSKTDHFETFVNIALYIKAKKEAQTILSPFRPNVLIPKNVQMLIQLQQQYGIDWLIELLDAWFHGKPSYLSNSSMDSGVINPFICEFLNAGGDKSVIEFLLKTEITNFTKKSVSWSTSFHFGRITDNLEEPRELFKACAAIGNSALQVILAEYVISQFPKKELVKLYDQLQKTVSPETPETFEPLRSHLIEAVKRELSLIRHVDDWSISTVLYCKCEHCKVLTNFMRSKTDIRKSWPANGNIRKHITSILKRSRAPVDVTVESKKKPYTIVLVKSAILHVEAAEKCTELKKILQTLESKTAMKREPPLVENDDRKRQKL